MRSSNIESSSSSGDGLDVEVGRGLGRGGWGRDDGAVDSGLGSGAGVRVADLDGAVGVVRATEASLLALTLGDELGVVDGVVLAVPGLEAPAGSGVESPTVAPSVDVDPVLEGDAPSAPGPVPSSACVEPRGVWSRDCWSSAPEPTTTRAAPRRMSLRVVVSPWERSRRVIERMHTSSSSFGHDLRSGLTNGQHHTVFA